MKKLFLVFVVLFLSCAPASADTIFGDLDVLGSIEQTGGRKITNKRITIADSPYVILATDYKIYCDTDGGAITVNLPAGINRTDYKIYNTGSNDVTVVPNGSELIDGVNASKSFAVGVVELSYESTEGWW